MEYQGVAESRHSREQRAEASKTTREIVQLCGIGILLGFYLSEVAMHLQPKAASLLPYQMPLTYREPDNAGQRYS